MFPTSARIAAIVLTASAAVSAQVVPQVVPLGGGCGNPKPAINSTLPLLTQDLTIFVTGMTPGCPIALFITPPPAAPFPFGANGECAAWIDLSLVASLAPPYVWTGAADARGNYSTTFPTIQLVGFAPGVPCNVQAVCITPPGTAGAANFFGYEGFVTDGIQIIMGDTPPGDPPSDVPAGACCTYSKGGFQGNGVPGQLFLNNYYAAFPNGLEVGDYAPGAAPNGKLFTSDAAGRTAVRGYLVGGGPSGAFTSDAVNNTSSGGGGNLGRQTAALAINVRLNDVGVIPNSCPVGGLVYVNAGDSLSGATVRQILDAANLALSGGGFPAGYNASSLNALVENLNLSFHECVTSTFAGLYLWQSNAN